jgi:hypothetical protein
MQLIDFEPPPSPSLDQQRDALKKGLGRAMQWALSGKLEDEPLLEACLRDQRYDRQCEGSRGDWLWRLIGAAGAVERFRVPILHALYDLSDERSANQLCELSAHYAESGDGSFRMRLYEIVEKKPFADNLWLGEAEILRLDGESAFLVATRVRGESLPGREWESGDGWLVDRAIEKIGEARVIELLDQTQDRGIVAFRSEWRVRKRNEENPGPSETYRDELQSISVGEILSAAESDDARIDYFRFRPWGRYATEDDLEAIIQYVRSAQSPVVIARLLRVFWNRAAPSFAPQFIELARLADDDVQRWATLALKQIELPLVRDYALAELGAGGRRARFAVGILARNFQPGDEKRVLESIELPDDDWDRHSLLMDVIKLLEADPEADPSALGLIVYACTPCENCRRDAAHILYDSSLAPRWLIDECRFDSSRECQPLVADIPEPPGFKTE